MNFSYTISEEQKGTRLDVFLVKALGAEQLEHVVPTRSKIAAWISDSAVSVNESSITKSGYKLSAEDVVFVIIPEAKAVSLEPDPSVTIDVVFEDDHLIVLDKAPGVVVHPAAGNFEKTLVHGLLAHVGDNIKQVGDALRPGIVHRLDKDTSGLMVVAKTDKTFLHLSEQFRPPRSIHREYLAIVAKEPKEESGEIEGAIGRHPVRRKQMAVVADGKPATTEWSVEQRFTYGCLLRLKLTTGRTHQIRVHLKYEGMPILGDSVYGISDGSLPQKLRPALRKFGRQALHAASLSFVHPDTLERVSFDSKMPGDMKHLASLLAG